MGVHYFYTWVTSRYPLIRRPLVRASVPRVDHLYLDLNGVLHRCAKDTSALFKDLLGGKRMQEIFSAVLNYVNRVIRMMSPTKSIFIAIDGVAPRAKMNNQRHRRFKQAVDSNNVDLFMTEILQVPMGTLDFKANSISPGTEFMFDLIQHMQYFVKRKLEEDPSWQHLKIRLSPGSVPGEGEHKIMDFLRGWSQSNEFEPRDVHCVYGNDSDLVLLSLKLHLPNIIILREQNKYIDKDLAINHAAKRFTEDDPMEILYINLLREYLFLEFHRPQIEESLNEGYTRADFRGSAEDMRVWNYERLIDDFVLVSCFIGNDFLPQLYCLSTKRGHFDRLIDAQRSFYIRHKKFLVFRERIDWLALKDFLALLRPLEEKIIDETSEMFAQELRRFDMKRRFLDESEMEEMSGGLFGGGGFRKKSGKKNRKKSSDMLELDEEQIQVRKQWDRLGEEDKDLFLLQYKKEYRKMAKALSRIDKMVDLRNRRTERREYYYTGYFDDKPEPELEEPRSSPESQSEIQNEDQPENAEGFGVDQKKVKSVDSKIGEMCRNYFEGMEFKHKYYTSGCPTWVWYYRFSVCPLITDMYHFLSEMEEEGLLSEGCFSVYEGKPFRPFVQLLHILPKQSFALLPPLFTEKVFSERRIAGSGEKEIIGDQQQSAKVKENDVSEETQDFGDLDGLDLLKEAQALVEESQAQTQEPDSGNDTERVPETREERLRSRSLIGSPVREEDFLGFWFEGDEMSDEWRNRELCAVDVKEFKAFFPEKFRVEARDNMKNYTWVPLITEVERDSMRKFVLEFPWGELSEEEKLRNAVGHNQMFEYDPATESLLEPTLKGLSPLKIQVKCTRDYWYRDLPRDPRGLDTLYLKREKMLALTKFKLPSFIDSYGGWGKVQAIHKLRFHREVIFLQLESSFFKKMLFHNPLKKDLELDRKIKSRQAKIKPEHMFRMQKKAAKQRLAEGDVDKFLNYPIRIQNEHISLKGRAVSMQQYQVDCMRYLRNQSGFQRFLVVDPLYPVKRMFLKMKKVFGEEKDRFVYNLGQKLERERFIDVGNLKEVCRDEQSLEVAELGVPSFSLLQMKIHDEERREEVVRSKEVKGAGGEANENQQLKQREEPKKDKQVKTQGTPKKEISFSLYWKEESKVRLPLFELNTQSLYPTIEDLKTSLYPLKTQLAPQTNNFKPIDPNPPLAINLTTGDLIELLPDALEILRRVEDGERFKDIPMITDYKILKHNRVLQNMSKKGVKGLEGKLMPVDDHMLKEIGLTRQDKWLLWLILDGVLVLCDRKQSSSLVLGMKFDLGLNFMKFFNKRVFDFQVVADMVRVFLERNYDMREREGLQALVDDFLLLKFLNMYLFFQGEGREYLQRCPSSKKRNKTNRRKSSDEMSNQTKRAFEDELNQIPNQNQAIFLKQKYAEFTNLATLIRSLTGKKRMEDWKKRILQLNRSSRSRDEPVLLSEMENYFSLENDRRILAEILSPRLGVKLREIPRLRVEHAGMLHFMDGIKDGDLQDLQMFIESMPCRILCTVEGWKIKTFSLYLSKKGKRSVRKYLRAQKELVEGLRRFNGRFWRLEVPHREGFVRLAVKTRFKVQELFPQLYKGDSSRSNHNYEAKRSRKNSARLRNDFTKKKSKSGRSKKVKSEKPKYHFIDLDESEQSPVNMDMSQTGELAGKVENTSQHDEQLAEKTIQNEKDDKQSELKEEKTKTENAEQLQQPKGANKEDESDEPISRTEPETDETMTNNLKSLLGIGFEQESESRNLNPNPPKSSKTKKKRKKKSKKNSKKLVQNQETAMAPTDPESKQNESPTDTHIETIFEELAEEFGEVLETANNTKPNLELNTKLEDGNIKLFHCYANILKEPHSSLLLQPALSRCYPIDTISQKLIRNLEQKTQNNSQDHGNKDKTPPIPIPITHLITHTRYLKVCWPPLLRKPPFHTLGDRVVHINPESDLQFGALGTVIGIYKEKIEVLLDRRVIGGEDLYGRTPPFRGKMLAFFDVFNLTRWGTLVCRRKHLLKSVECWEGSYNFDGLISQIKKDSQTLKKRPH